MRLWARLVVALAVTSVAVAGAWQYTERSGHSQTVAIAIAAIVATIVVALAAVWVSRAQEARRPDIRGRSRSALSVSQWLALWANDTLLPKSIFARKYRKYLIAGLQFIDLRDLSKVGYFTPEIDEVYVDVSLTFRPPHKVSPALLGDQPPDPSERRDFASFLNHKVPELLAVIGAPGSGKTTLLRRTARQICLKPYKYRRRIPILLYLRDHAKHIVDAPRTVTMASLVRRMLGSLATEEPREWLEKNLSRGNCVVLLDGLDEVARPDDRSVVASWVDEQRRQYPKNDYIITSRPLGYQTARIEGASVLQVRDFTAMQVADFVRGWYRAAVRHGPDAGDKKAMREAMSEADDLLRTLDNRPALHDLTANPLLLTMMVNVHREGDGKLPDSRAELYAEIIQVVVWRRQEAKKNLPSSLPGAAREVPMQALAYTMMHRQRIYLLREEVLTVINSALRRWRDKVTADDLLRDASTNGLLVERESGQYSFVHKTLQEYLAAVYILDNGDVRELAAAVDDPWWRETTLLYAARGDASPVVRACLTSGTPRALALAFHCADQGTTIAPDIQRQLGSIIEDASRPGTDPARRRLVAGVLLARQMRNLIRVANGGYICGQRIPILIYRLFLEDNSDLVSDVFVTAGKDDKTASGIMAVEAARFISWANSVIGDGSAYRLPTMLEAEDAADLVRHEATVDEVAEQCTWTGNGQPGGPVLRIPPGLPHPYAISLDELRAQVVGDFANATSIAEHVSLIHARLLLRRLVQDLDELYKTIKKIGSHNAERRIDAVGSYRFTIIHLLNAAGLPSELVNQLHEDLADALAISSPPYMASIDPEGHRLRFVGHALSVGRKLLAAAEEGLRKDFGRDELIYRALGLGTYRGGGGGLGQALANSLPCNHSELSGMFSLQFAELTVMERFVDHSDNLVVSFDDLTAYLTSITNWFMTGHSDQASEKPNSSEWAWVVARWLQYLSTPVINRGKKVNPSIASAIRLAALTLKSEVPEDDPNLRRTDLLQLAAGVTVLEWRIAGRRSTPETLVLATD